MTTSYGVSISHSKNTTKYSRNRAGAAAFADVLPSPVSLSPWIMTIRRDSSGDFSVSCATEEFSGPGRRISLSKQHLMSVILLLVEHLGEMS